MLFEESLEHPLFCNKISTRSDCLATEKLTLHAKLIAERDKTELAFFVWLHRVKRRVHILVTSSNDMVQKWPSLHCHGMKVFQYAILCGRDWVQLGKTWRGIAKPIAEPCASMTG